MMVGEVKPWTGTLWFIFSAEKCLLVLGFEKHLATKVKQN